MVAFFCLSLFFFFQSRRFVFGLGGFFPVFFHSEDVALFPLILFFFETVPEINQKTLFLPSESTYMMLMPTGTTFHWP